MPTSDFTHGQLAHIEREAMRAEYERERAEYDALIARAREMGAEHGRAAASWYFDGNTDDATYRRVLIGLEDGDPEVLDTLPSAPLSGEWADSPTPLSVCRELDIDDDDDAADDALMAYEDGFADAVEAEITTDARRQVFTVDAFAWPGGYPIGYLTDDGAYLCSECVSDESNPVHLSDPNDGWRIMGSEVLEGSAADYDGGINCVHCGAVLVEADDDEPDPRDLARAMSRRFTRRTRDDGTSYTTLTDEADDWMRDVVREAHETMLPDDWRYDVIAAAVEFIADEADWDDRRDEFADGCVSTYSADLHAWLGSHSFRADYVQQARDEWGDAGESIWDECQRGQLIEAREVLDIVAREFEERSTGF